MITIKMSFTHFHSSSCQGNIFHHQNLATYQSKLQMRKQSQPDKDYGRKLALKFHPLSIDKDKDRSIRFKMHQTFLFILPVFALYLLSACDLFNMSYLSAIFRMDSLDNLCSNFLNFKNKITKIENEKIFCDPSKNLKNIL